MVKIRLARHGKKSCPCYDIVVSNSRSPRNGKFIERIGYYHPVTMPKDSCVVCNSERLKYWLSVGAVPTVVVIKKLSKLSEFSSLLGKFL